MASKQTKMEELSEADQRKLNVICTYYETNYAHEFMAEEEKAKCIIDYAMQPL